MLRYRSVCLDIYFDNLELFTPSLPLQSSFGIDLAPSTCGSAESSFLPSLHLCSTPLLALLLSSLYGKLFLLHFFSSLRSSSSCPTLVHCSSLHGHFVVGSSLQRAQLKEKQCWRFLLPGGRYRRPCFDMGLDIARFALAFLLLFLPFCRLDMELSISTCTLT